jgi:hypothetical protein
MGKILRFAGEEIRIGSDELSQSPLKTPDSADHAVHLIAGSKGGNAWPYLYDRSGHVDAEHSGQRLSVMRGLGSTNLDVERIDSAGRNPYQNLVAGEWFRFPLNPLKWTSRRVNHPNCIAHPMDLLLRYEW